MQIATCEIRLAGDIMNSVRKVGVTPAEVIVLRSIHGLESVINIEVTGIDRRSHLEEFNRLSASYKSAMDANSNPLVHHLFPAAPMGGQLPGEFKDIGIDIYADTDAPKRRDLHAESEEVKAAREIYETALKDEEERQFNEDMKRDEKNSDLAKKIVGEQKKADQKDPSWTPPQAPASSHV